MIEYFAYAITGRVCIFFLQKFPFEKISRIGGFFKDGGFLHDLIICDLCLGVWVYTFLAFCFSPELLYSFFYVPFVSELIVGAATSLLMHLLRLGWQSKFSVIEVH